MAGMKLRLTGDWATAARTLDQVGSKLTKAIDRAVRQEAEDARKQIVEGIQKQAPAGEPFLPLSRLARAIRRASGFNGTKALIRTAAMKNGVRVHRAGRNSYFVGVLRGAQSKGRSLVSIARIQEEGATFVVKVTPKMRAFLMIAIRKAGLGRRRNDGSKGRLSRPYLVVKIPPRPFIGPVIAKIRGNPLALRARLGERIARELGYTLGK
jgi:hypothetical protein